MSFSYSTILHHFLPRQETSFPTNLWWAIISSKLYFWLYMILTIFHISIMLKSVNLWLLERRIYPLLSEIVICGQIYLESTGNLCPGFCLFGYYFILTISSPFRPLPPELLSDYLRLSDARYLRKNSSKSSPSKSELGESTDSVDPSELEQMLGFPVGYSDVNNLTKAKRISVLSKSWSVPILSHVMWALVDFFESNWDEISRESII